MSTWDILNRNASPKAPILYVGANTGQHIPDMRRTGRGAHIYAFEPDMRAFTALAGKFGQDADVTLVPLAVADMVGTRPFYVNEFSATSSLFAWNPDSRHLVAKYRTARVAITPATTLDRFCRERDILQVGLLFMDMQGGELLALRGAAELLRCRAIGAICGEVLFIDIYAGAPSFCDIYGFLARYGYEFHGFVGHKAGGDGRWKWGNFLFVRENE